MYTISKVIITLGALIAPSIAFSGDMTYYTPGLGSCGWTNSQGDAVVAMSPGQNGNCGRMINIHYNGKTTSAKVVDLCPGCAGDGIDVSQSVFEQFASLDVGRVSVTWEYA